MTDQSAFLGDKHKAAIVAMSVSVLLLLPSSLGIGGTIIQQAFAQFNLPLLDEGDTEGGGLVVEDDTTTTTTPSDTTTTPSGTTTTPSGSAGGSDNPAAYLLAERNSNPLRGFMGTTLPAPGAGGNAPADGSGYVVTGRNRIFANDSGVESFVTEMNIAAIDGSSFHNITIREGDPHRFEATAGNGTTSASASMTGNIFVDGAATPAVENAPMTLVVRGQTVALEGIDIDETRITDPTQQQILSIIDGQTIYGTVPRT
jgi:hypothetical protein